MKRKNVIFSLFILVIISILLIGCPEINLGTSSSSGSGDGSSTVTDTEIITNTAVTSWTAPAGYSTLTAKITLVGAGGGGGAAFSTPSGQVYGCGGEAGIVNGPININLISGNSYSLTIGIGGDGGIPNGLNATSGSSTSITIITKYEADGGSGGLTYMDGPADDRTDGKTNTTIYGKGGDGGNGTTKSFGDDGTNGAIIIEWTGTK